MVKEQLKRAVNGLEAFQNIMVFKDGRFDHLFSTKRKIGKQSTIFDNLMYDRVESAFLGVRRYFLKLNLIEKLCVLKTIVARFR